MSEHGWPEFPDDGGHHDGGDHHEDLAQHHEPGGVADDGYADDAHHDDPLLGHDVAEHDQPETPEPPAWPDGHDAQDGHDPQDGHDAQDGHDGPQEADVTDPAGSPELGTVGADPDALAEPGAADAVSTFPPVLDVGPLPEPVDGFPWIDTGSLGPVEPGSLGPVGPANGHTAAPAGVEPGDLAEYAGTELPPGQDPWAALAGAEDPATSALAKWWSESR